MGKIKNIDAQEVEDIKPRKKRIKKMKYHPVANFKGCKNC